MTDTDFNHDLRESIKAALISFRGRNNLTINRQLSNSFVHIFADSLYDYEKGVILLDRFYRESACQKIGVPIKDFSSEDKELIKDVKDELQSLLKGHVLGTGDKEGRQLRITELEDKLKGIIPSDTLLDAYVYDGLPLSKFDLYEDSQMDVLADVYAAFAVNTLLFMSFGTASYMDYMISSIDGDDYTDLIIVPIKKESE